MFRTAKAVWRHRKGASTIELAASVFILMLFVIAISKFGALSIDTDRDARAVRSGLDLVWQLDEEIAAPTQADADRLRDALARLSRIGGDDRLDVHFTLVRANSSNTPSVGWTLSSGSGGQVPASRLSISGSEVVIGEASYDLRDDEKLIVVETIRTGRGLGETSRAPSYSFGVAYKRDLSTGP